MSDVNPGATPPAAPVQAQNGLPAQPANTPAYITQEQLNEALKPFATLAPRLDGISGKLSALERTKPAGEPPPKQNEPADLTQRVQKIEAQAKAIGDQKRASILHAAFAKPFGTRSDKAVTYVMATHGSKIEVDENFNVFYRESDDIKTPLDQWAKAYAATDEAELFIPPVNGGGEGNKRQGAPAPAALPATLTDAMSNPNEYAKLLREQPEYVQSLRQKAAAEKPKRK